MCTASGKPPRVRSAGFWYYFAGPAGAAVIGFVSSMGHLGGFTGPYLMGFFRELYDNFTFGLCGLAVALLISAIAAWSVRNIDSRQ